jgi:hypothetical protein
MITDIPKLFLVQATQQSREHSKFPKQKDVHQDPGSENIRRRRRRERGTDQRIKAKSGLTCFRSNKMNSRSLCDIDFQRSCADAGAGEGLDCQASKFSCAGVASVAISQTITPSEKMSACDEYLRGRCRRRSRLSAMKKGEARKGGERLTRQEFRGDVTTATRRR